ncbi:Receptor-like protein kinase [Melia azedarach]|uniref:Receptor-like protein kinase n=1 Tax=Melia azedarach TaxID=155640 RepID=A0ACC1XF44_MELAZ|nr:Receptor-like protein kinase [Melia azedarach]
MQAQISVANRSFVLNVKRKNPSIEPPKVTSPYKISPMKTSHFGYLMKRCSMILVLSRTSFYLNYTTSEVTCAANATSNTTTFVALVPRDEDLNWSRIACDSVISSPVQLGEEEIHRTIKGFDYVKLLKDGFSLKWTGYNCAECRKSGGQCGFENENSVCFCSDGSHPYGCNDGDGKLRLRLGLGLGTLSAGICILIILAYCFKKKLCSANSIIFWKKTAKNYQNIEAFLRNCGSLALKRYTYSDIKKMTNSFKHKLGQGGYGGVYKGKLLDGRNIAVKVLNESKGNGEDFINEVASISRTSHINIVDSFGLFRHIARGLEYLHRGCSTRILHFDIKPHNILLDEDFCPKISDFGLAKICPRKESVVSMTGATGTVGYIAPEVFCRNFGEVSHKSDVYSYGMMVFEMTGRKNNGVGNNRSSDAYFPDWVYKYLETDEELILQGIENGEDKEYARKMIIVSLWCIQTIPSNRPTISRVVEMLEGSLESLQIPPRPFLSSPGLSQADSLTIQGMITL